MQGSPERLRGFRIGKDLINIKLHRVKQPSYDKIVIGKPFSILRISSIRGLGLAINITEFRTASKSNDYHSRPRKIVSFIQQYGCEAIVMHQMRTIVLAMAKKIFSIDGVDQQQTQ